MNVLTQPTSDSHINTNLQLWRRNEPDNKAESATSSKLAPIHRLPVEVLGEIFRLCLHTKRAVFQRLHDLSKEAPSLLCRVCSAWRSVALAIPDLWTRLSLSIDLPPTCYDVTIKKYSILIAQRLSRTGLGNASGRLSLTFDLYGIHIAPCEQFILDVVIPNLDRCLHLHLRIEDTLHVAPLASLLPRRLEQLESLILERGMHSYSVPASHPVITAFNASPRLRKVSTSFIASDGAHIRRTFPWEQLTFLNISEQLEVACWKSLLSRCTNLKQGIFVIGDGEPDEELPPSTNLMSLKLSDLTVTYTVDCFSSLFNEFNLSALTNLRLLRTTLAQNMLFNTFEPDFVRQLHALRKFSVLGDLMLASHLKALLRRAPSLMELEIDASLAFRYEGLFRFLLQRGPDRQNSVLPQLTTLTIYVAPLSPRNNGSYPFPCEGLVDLMVSVTGESFSSPFSCNVFLDPSIYSTVSKEVEAALESRSLMGLMPNLKLKLDNYDSPRHKIRDMGLKSLPADN